MLKYTLLLSVLLVFVNIYGSSFNEDRYKELISKSLDKTISKDKRIEYANNVIKLSLSSKNNKIINKAYLNYGQVTINLSMYIETIKVLQKAINNNNFTNDSIILGQIYNTQGVAFGELSQRVTAIKQFNKALFIFKQKKYIKGINQTLNNIGLVYYYNNDYKKAKNYLLKVLELKKNTDKNIDVGSTYINLGNIYVKEKEYDKGEYYFKKIINSTDTSSVNLKTLAINSLSKLYQELGEISKAYNTINLIQKYPNASPKLKYVIFSESKADIISDMDSINEARILYTHALKYADKLNLVYKKIDLYKKLAKIYYNLKNTDKSYEYLNETIEIMDSLRLSEIIENSKLQEEFFIHEYERFKLIKEKKSAELKVKKQQIWLLLFVSFLLLLIVVIVLTIKNHKNKIKYIKETNKLKLEYQIELATQLEAEIDTRIEQFTEVAIILSQQNEFLKDVRKSLDTIKAKEYPSITDLKIRLTTVIAANQDKEVFYNAVQNTNQQFLNSLKNKYPQITDNEVRLICLSKLNLSNKEISSLIGTSLKSVEMAKYRLKKKLKLKKEDSIDDILKSL